MARRSSRSGRGTTGTAERTARTRAAPSPDDGTSVPRAPAPRGFLAWIAEPPGFAAAAAGLTLTALVARLVTWSWIFGTGRVELVPADSHYYVRLARLTREAGRLVAADPFVGFPLGSENYWPPLHTLLVAALAGLRPDPEAGVALAGPVASVLWLIPIAWAARRALGPGRALLCLLLLALLPVAIEAGKVGNADHNVHEAPLAALVLLLGTLGARGSTGAAIAAGATAGAARLFTTTGFVLPGLLALGWALAAAVATPADRAGATRRVALAGAACAGTLLAAVLAVGRPGRLDYEALTLFHPLLAASLFGAAVAASGLLEGRRALAAAGGAAALAGVAALPALLRAAGHLARRDPLLAVVAESRPLAADPVLALALFGPVVILLPVALVGALGALRRRRAPELALPVGAALLFLLGALAQSRMAPFLAGASAVLVPSGLALALAAAGPRAERWGRWGVALALLPLLALLIPPAPPAVPARAATIRPTLVWMRDNLPPASADPWDPAVAPTYGVLAPFDYGHFVTLYAERPVLASTFSQTEAHVRANREATEILLETDEERAYARMRALDLAYVLAAPSGLFGQGPLPADALLPRLLRRDSFGRFRPLHVSEERRPGGGRLATVFQLVEGALLTGSAPAGTRVQAALEDGYARAATAGLDGVFRIRVARPGRFRLSAGDRARPVEVTEAQVAAGAEVPVGEAGG